jgi:hypothetical protein
VTSKEEIETLESRIQLLISLLSSLLKDEALTSQQIQEAQRAITIVGDLCCAGQTNNKAKYCPYIHLNV